VVNARFTSLVEELRPNARQLQDLAGGIELPEHIVDTAWANPCVRIASEAYEETGSWWPVVRVELKTDEELVAMHQAAGKKIVELENELKILT
jgi:hypothetical protein